MLLMTLNNRAPAISTMLNKQLFPLLFVYVAVAMAMATASSKAAKDALVTRAIWCIAARTMSWLRVKWWTKRPIRVLRWNQISLLSTGRTIDDRQSAFVNA
ncbi:hypothetical protein RDI58_020372 [Solanum bulbocastanum]|uniref:Uncharacterized protein n=1 Tax=Solanum bulbocastanum TaxID=147425 RepID=A0AAN8Y8I6_SOLBU